MWYLFLYETTVTPIRGKPYKKGHWKPELCENDKAARKAATENLSDNTELVFIIRKNRLTAGDGTIVSLNP